MTDATDPLLRDPLVQYLGVLRAQHADYNPLSHPDFAEMVEPYLVASRGIADLVVAAIESLGDRGLEEVVGLLRGMLEPIVSAASPERAIGEAVDFVAAILREENPPTSPRYTVEPDGTYALIRDRLGARTARFSYESTAELVAASFNTGETDPEPYLWSPAS